MLRKLVVEPELIIPFCFVVALVSVGLYTFFVMDVVQIIYTTKASMEEMALVAAPLGVSILPEGIFWLFVVLPFISIIAGIAIIIASLPSFTWEEPRFVDPTRVPSPLMVVREFRPLEQH